LHVYSDRNPHEEHPKIVVIHPAATEVDMFPLVQVLDPSLWPRDLREAAVSSRIADRPRRSCSPHTESSEQRKPLLAWGLILDNLN
jgi:hypothetical protein